MSGKGDSRRPTTLSQQEWAERWLQAFGDIKAAVRTGHRVARETGRTALNHSVVNHSPKNEPK